MIFVPNGLLKPSLDVSALCNGLTELQTVFFFHTPRKRNKKVKKNKVVLCILTYIYLHFQGAFDLVNVLQEKYFLFKIIRLRFVGFAFSQPPNSLPKICVPVLLLSHDPGPL